MEKTVEEIKALFIRNNIPVFGMGPASSLETAPPGYRPSDTLQGSESILCLGVPFPKGIFQCAGRSNENYWRAANIYYRNIDAILMQAARIIEDRGGVAVPVFG